MLRPYNNATGAAPFESLMVADIGDIPINTYNLAATVDIIHNHIATVAGHGCKPLILGGDHTITYPILQGIKVSHRYLASLPKSLPIVAYKRSLKFGMHLEYPFEIQHVLLGLIRVI